MNDNVKIEVEQFEELRVRFLKMGHVLKPGELERGYDYVVEVLHDMPPITLTNKDVAIAFILGCELTKDKK